MEIGGSSLRELARIKDIESRRISSYDRTGGNRDYFIIPAGQSSVIADYIGNGCITHIWVTLDCRDPYYLRKIVLRAWWDQEEEPSIEVPVGDFFGLGHGQSTYFTSLPLQMFKKGFNCWFPMPFSKGFRFEVENECEEHDVVFYFYIDFELYSTTNPKDGRFHAQWRRENPTTVHEIEQNEKGNLINRTGRDNYIVFEAEGEGHYVGCHIDIDMPTPGWWGEGDDMFFIDGDVWPPTLHGTGTEDYFCGAWNYNLLHKTYCAPYFGYHFKTNEDYTGKHSQYRFHIEDPIRFKKSILFSIEHGHANNKMGDWSSTAYWYQIEPHKKFPVLLPVLQRLPDRWGGIEGWNR